VERQRSGALKILEPVVEWDVAQQPLLGLRARDRTSKSIVRAMAGSA
jgi:hypothetical protein